MLTEMMMAFECLLFGVSETKIAKEIDVQIGVWFVCLLHVQHQTT